MEAAEEVVAVAEAPGQVEPEEVAAVGVVVVGEEGAAVEEVGAPRAGPRPLPGTPADRHG